MAKISDRIRIQPYFEPESDPTKTPRSESYNVNNVIQNKNITFLFLFEKK